MNVFQFNFVQFPTQIVAIIYNPCIRAELDLQLKVFMLFLVKNWVCHFESGLIELNETNQILSD
jgi:hypothetical protein